MECDKCKKNMTDSDGASVIGLSIRVDVKNSPKRTQEFFEKQLGKFSVNRDYNFCYECWLDSLFGGVKCN